MSIKPSKGSYYNLESIWVQWSFAPRNRLDFWSPTGRWRHPMFSQTCQHMPKHRVVM